ncbi:MAG: hemolysin family protein [Actinobacteria bacterium]|nr:hemolysin family protein [Actinomycetota bacterium]
MSASTWLEIALVLLFILIGGVFACTELALVSLRESQVAQLSRQGARGARVAAVARNPNRFLAAVQIGVTVAGFLSAAFGASSLAPELAPVFVRAGLSAGASDTVSLVVLTLVIAYLSLVLGELVPKRIALQRAASIAMNVAPPLDVFATVMTPFIWLLSVSTNAIVRLLGLDPTQAGETMSEGELRDLVRSHPDLPDDERRLIDEVFEAGDRSLSEVMKPRGEVAFLNAADDAVEASALVRTLPYSRYPVIGEDFDEVVGFVHVRDLLGAVAEVTAGAAHPTVGSVARPITSLPGTNALLPTLSSMRRTRSHIVVVVDEYGGTDGIVTLEDLLEELVGDIVDEYDLPAAAPSEAGEIDAGLTVEEFAERTGLNLTDGPYETVAGYVLSRLGRLAEPGDRVDVVDPDGRTRPGVHLEVAAIDGRRIAGVRVVRVPSVPGGEVAPDTATGAAADSATGAAADVDAGPTT